MHIWITIYATIIWHNECQLYGDRNFLTMECWACVYLGVLPKCIYSFPMPAMYSYLPTQQNKKKVNDDSICSVAFRYFDAYRECEKLSCSMVLAAMFKYYANTCAIDILFAVPYPLDGRVYVFFFAAAVVVVTATIWCCYILFCSRFHLNPMLFSRAVKSSDQLHTACANKEEEEKQKNRWKTSETHREQQNSVAGRVCGWVRMCECNFYTANVTLSNRFETKR